MIQPFECECIGECINRDHADHFQWWIHSDRVDEFPCHLNFNEYLICAVTMNSAKVAEVSISHGADVNFGEITIPPPRELIRYPLEIAVKEGCPDALLVLLENNATESKLDLLETALHKYCYNCRILKEFRASMTLSKYRFYCTIKESRIGECLEYLVKYAEVIRILLGHDFSVDASTAVNFFNWWRIHPGNSPLDSVMIGIIEKIPDDTNPSAPVWKIDNKAIIHRTWPTVFYQFPSETGEICLHRIEGLSSYWKRDRIGLLTTLLLGRRSCPSCPFHEDALPLEIFEMIMSYSRLFFFPGEISKTK